MAEVAARERALDEHCGGVRPCPISRGPCPGECIFAEVMESQHLGVVVFDLARESLLFANRSARGLFAALGQPVEFAGLARLLLGPGGGAGDGDGSARSLRVGARLLGYTVYGSGAFAWVLVRDITEKVRLESIAEAVETMNNMGYVFAAVRHELGNPINSVKAALSVLRANLRTFPAEAVDEYLQRMTAELGRVETLLRSLKSFSMYESPQLEALDLGPFLEGFGGLVAVEAGRRGVELSLEVPAPCQARCDPRALQQVLLNLFANAADALGAQAAPRIEVSAAAGDGLVTLRFADNGAGMDGEQLGHLFKPFHTSKEHGTGLGLVIARKLLSAMGGTIAVESRAGAGTAVIVTLPEWRSAAGP